MDVTGMTNVTKVNKVVFISPVPRLPSSRFSGIQKLEMGLRGGEVGEGREEREGKGEEAKEGRLTSVCVQ
jgi:hypothetical protein